MITVADLDAVGAEIWAGWRRVLDDLDDTTVDAVPTVATRARLNSVFALVTHVDGVVGSWLATLVGGEDVARDRASEFDARGSVADAHALLDRAEARSRRGVRVALTEGIRRPAAPSSSTRDVASATPGWVVLHVWHELAQHLGHAELCRDLVTAPAHRSSN